MSRIYRALGVFLLILATLNSSGQDKKRLFSIDFYEGTLSLEMEETMLIDVPSVPSAESVKHFYAAVSRSHYQSLIDSLLSFRQKYQLNDWLYYQLIRKTAQQISPKAANYTRYTLYKWFLLARSGYDARLALSPDKIIFYVYNNEDISDIPFFMVDNKKFMCLNYHDYPRADLNQDPPVPITIKVPEARKAFSYKVTKMPDFKPETYREKDLEFSYKQKVYHFRVKLNPEVETIFKNYPGVDFESYFNIPLSKETYSSLIPMLKKNVERMNQKKGVDYLMRFTRYAFLYEDDEENYGKEKRLSAEETLFAKYSDCDDRAALFFYLVKEIYNLPMIAVLYPTHITMAVQFDKPVGKPIIYKGRSYSFCEPTLQKEDLHLGQISSKLRNTPYEIVYQYDPR
ncbi:hypothetical protein [Pararcticibacter amylolyticus]|uniref:hypothetical protein n=1 Tax=Pararcticibacter amylolyticus TaxID=2173175 RepID=UPI001EE3D550|nr:hypothetical protein [Pararcticibacter amylolyticus]